MKIAIAISRYRRTGGLERVSGEWARGLATRGHDITVFCQEVDRGPGDDALRFVHVGGFGSPIAARAATFPPAATRAIGSRSFEAVISFGCTVAAPGVIVRLPGAHRPWWELANRLAPVTTYEGARRRLNPHHRIVLAWEKRVLRPGVAGAVLAASERAAADIRRLYPRVAGIVRVVPDGIDLEAFVFSSNKREATRRAWRAEDAFVILTVATEVRRKGIATLLEAFARVVRHRPDALLVVAGTAPRGEVERLASEHGVADRTLAVGFVPDLAAAYSAADLFVFPTIFDPWGLPVVEALACGTPAIGSVVAGSSQVITRKNGMLIPENATSGAVSDLLLEGSRLPTDRESVRATVEHLSWRRVLDEVEVVLP